MLARQDRIHAAGSYTTVGAAFAAVSQGMNWAGAYTGVGTATITLTEQIDATEKVVIATSGTAGQYVVYVAATSTDATLDFAMLTDAGVAGEGIVHFVVLRVQP